MRSLPKDNPTKPLNEDNLENLIEEYELDARNNLNTIRSLAQDIARIAERTEQSLILIERMKSVLEHQK